MTKVAIMDGDEVVDTLLRPTGFNSAVTGKFLEVVHAFMTCR